MVSRRVSGVVAIGLLGLGLYLVPRGEPAVASTESTLVVPHNGEARTLSPDISSDNGNMEVASNVYSALVVNDTGAAATGAFAYGDLAKSWDTSADGKTYTFHIYPGVKWHDGYPLTAEDIKFTFDRIIAKKYPYSAYLKAVESISVPDPLTLVITLRDPDASFVPMLAQASLWFGKIYPKHLWAKEEGFDTGPYVNHPIGSGPFRFVRWDRDESVELHAFKGYFRGPPKLDRLFFRPMHDANVARAEFDAGHFPWLSFHFQVAREEIPALLANPAVKVIKAPSLLGYDLVINMRRKPFSDLRVRQAIAYAIDRPMMKRLAFADSAASAYHAGLDNLAWTNLDATFPGHDKARAEALLDAAGLPRKPDGYRFAATLIGSTEPSCLATNQVMTEELREIGVDVTLRTSDLVSWYQRLHSGDFDLTCYFTRYGPDPAAYMEHFGTGGARNFSGYSNPEFDRLGNAAVRIQDMKTRIPYYKKMQTMIVRDIPYVNLSEGTVYILARPQWKGLPYEESAWGKGIGPWGFYAVVPPGKA